MRLLVALLSIIMGITIGWEIAQNHDGEDDNDEC